MEPAPHRRWHCCWIWAPGDAGPRGGLFRGDADLRRAPDQTVLLRRTFRLERVPAAAPARITADSRYALFVNGAPAARGPVRGDASKLRYDPLDLAPYLREGENVLAVQARYYGTAVPWWAPARPSLGLGSRGALAFELRLGEGRWLGSDASWRALRPEGWSSAPRGGVSPMPVECVDAARMPVGWRDAGFDDGAWDAAEELQPLSVGGTREKAPPSSPYGALLPRPIPQLEGETRVPRVSGAVRVPAAHPDAHPARAARADAKREPRTPVSVGGELPVTLSGEGTHVLTLDFGEVVAGLVGLEVDAPAGVEIDLATHEWPGDPSATLDPTSDASFRYRARGRDDAFETFDPIGLRLASLAVRGATRPVTLRRFWCREQLYPVRTGPGFRCSDPVLERIYEVGRRSVSLNAQDAYLDCPTREQRAWTGDAVVHQMVHLASNADWGLARWHPEMAASPRPDGMLPMAAGGDSESLSVTIPEWPLHWIRSLWNLWRYTGDAEGLRALLPTAEGVLRWLLPYRGGHGLACHVAQWVLIDWAALHLGDTSACLNAQWARALLEFADVSEWLGDAGRAAWARGLHAELRDAFELFWDEARGVYVDHAVEGAPQRPVSQHAGATAVWAGLVPEARVDRVLDAVTDRSRLVRVTWAELYGQGYLVNGPGPATWDVEREIVAAQPFYRYVVHDALAGAGRADAIVDQCRDWSAFLERGETSWPELWEGGTHSHGWGSTPTRDLVVHTLGIQPEAPGFEVARVAPRLGDLRWAEGAAPTPSGLLRVRADHEAGELRVDSPVPVVIDLPGGKPERLGPGSHVLSFPAPGSDTPEEEKAGPSR